MSSCHCVIDGVIRENVWPAPGKLQSAGEIQILVVLFLLGEHLKGRFGVKRKDFILCWKVSNL